MIKTINKNGIKQGVQALKQGCKAAWAHGPYVSKPKENSKQFGGVLWPKHNVLFSHWPKAHNKAQTETATKRHMERIRPNDEQQVSQHALSHVNHSIMC